MGLTIEFDRDALRPLVHLAVTEALAHMEEERAKLNGRLALTGGRGRLAVGREALRSSRLPSPRRDRRHRRSAARSSIPGLICWRFWTVKKTILEARLM